MRSAEQNLGPGPAGRLLSLDVFRGFTMFLLVAEATGLYELLVDPAFGGTVVQAIGTQFHHHPWNGLRFWDLIQPFFMFIVGVAMPFSYGKRWDEGATWASTFRHALKRSFLLLLFGWALYCIGPGRLTFELWNVLAQLAFTCLVAFLMMRRSTPAQIAFSIGLLALTEILYRAWAVPGFDQPFVADRNFGSWVDMALMGKLSEGHWVAFNAVPTAAHTMWGVLAGLLLRSRRSPVRKIGTLAAVGLVLAVAGYALDPVTPIVKRIATSTFVLASGGWCLLALALAYGLIDIVKVRLGWKFLAIVGMNPLFIYLFAETGGAEWLRRIAKPFTEGIFGGLGEPVAAFATSLAVLAMLWGLCYALTRKRIFLRI
jgi:predicted acyltransferase